MQLLLLLLALCFGGFLYNTPALWPVGIWKPSFTFALPVPAVKHVINQTVSVDMYALTTCGHCKNMARKMTEAGIKFSRYDIDANPSRVPELNQRMQNAGFLPGGSVPIIFIGRHVFSGEVPIDTIEELIQ